MEALQFIYGLGMLVMFLVQIVLSHRAWSAMTESGIRPSVILVSMLVATLLWPIASVNLLRTWGRRG